MRATADAAQAAHHRLAMHRGSGEHRRLGPRPPQPAAMRPVIMCARAGTWKCRVRVSTSACLSVRTPNRLLMETVQLRTGIAFE